MTAPRAITLLHISDPQFGPKYRFSGTGHDTLFGRLRDDFEAMRARHGLAPDLILITGDLVETGKPSEFREFREFAETLADYFGLPRRKLVLIPGNHDISRAASEAYFKECEADEIEPVQPYWPKLKHYAKMFADFYAGEPGLTFTESEPYTLYEYPDLKLVVAGLNSTIADSHLPEHHHGFLGETQLRHFAGKLRTFAEQGWLRIAAVHHNPTPTGNSSHDIRDLADLKRFLRPYLNLVVHGHVHEESLEWLAQHIPVIGVGSAGVDLKQRPPEVPNQYQWIRVHADRLEYGSRAYIPDQKRWIDDLRADLDGSQWWQSTKVDFERVTGAFTPVSHPPTAPDDLLAGAISRHRAAIARLSRRSIRLFDLATYGEDSGIPPLDLLKIFIPQHALREVPSRDRAPWEPEPAQLAPREPGFTPEAGQPPRSIAAILADEEHPWALILGAPGAGKSTLTHWVVLKLAAEGEALGDLPLDLVPVRVDLRLFAERRSAALKAGEAPYNFLDYLGGLHHDYPQHLGREQLQVLADAGRLFWLFDGLDEVADSRMRDDVAAMIVAVRQQYRGRGLITGRIVGCRELQPRFHDGDIHCFTLRDFDPDQIDEFLDRWHALAFPGAPEVAAARRARFKKLLAENHTLRDLCGNPLLLTLIALLNRGDELPRRRHQLLERAAELMLGQWDANRGLPNATRFDLGVKRRYLAELAWHMLTELPGGAGNLVQSDALHAFTARFAQRHLSADPGTADSTARALIKHLRERNYVLGFLGGDSFGFLHKAFFEYFSAFEIISRFHNHDFSLEDLERIFATHWSDYAWRSSLLLLCGLLQEGRPEHVVSVLQAAVGSTQPLIPFTAFAHLGDLTVRGLSEFSELNRGVGRDFALAINEWLYRAQPWNTLGDVLTRAFHSAAGRWPGLGEVIDLALDAEADEECLLPFLAGLSDDAFIERIISLIESGRLHPSIADQARAFGRWQPDFTQRLHDRLLSLARNSAATPALALALALAHTPFMPWPEAIRDAVLGIIPPQFIDLVRECLTHMDADVERHDALASHLRVALTLALSPSWPDLALVHPFTVDLFRIVHLSPPASAALRAALAASAPGRPLGSLIHEAIRERNIPFLEQILASYEGQPDHFAHILDFLSAPDPWREGLECVIHWAQKDPARGEIALDASAHHALFFPEGDPLLERVGRSLDVYARADTPRFPPVAWFWRIALSLGNLRTTPLVLQMITAATQRFPADALELRLLFAAFVLHDRSEDSLLARALLEAETQRPLLAISFRKYLRNQPQVVTNSELPALLADLRSPRDERYLLQIAETSRWVSFWEKKESPWQAIFLHLVEHATTSAVRIQAAVQLCDRTVITDLQRIFPADKDLQAAIDLLDARDRLLRVGKLRRAIVRLAGTRVGSLTELPGGVIRFAYDPEYLGRPGAPPVAPTLPLRSEPYDTQGLHPIFANLLPQGWLLDIDLRKYQLNPGDQFGLLLATGRDTIGAIEILPEP